LALIRLGGRLRLGRARGGAPERLQCGSQILGRGMLTGGTAKDCCPGDFPRRSAGTYRAEGHALFPHGNCEPFAANFNLASDRSSELHHGGISQSKRKQVTRGNPFIPIRLPIQILWGFCPNGQSAGPELPEFVVLSGGSREVSNSARVYGASDE